MSLWHFLRVVAVVQECNNNEYFSVIFIKY